MRLLTQRRREQLTVGAIASVIGTALWFLVPALGRFAARSIALGGSLLVDRIYQSAALDPGQEVLAQSIVVVSLAVTMVGVAFSVNAYFVKSSAGKALREATELRDEIDGIPPHAHPPQADLKTRAARVYATTKRRAMLGGAIFWFTATYSTVAAVYALVGAVVLKQAIETRRVFEANVAICVPYMEPGREAKFRSRFAQMRAKKDYDAIKADLSKIAADAKVRLVEP